MKPNQRPQGRTAALTASAGTPRQWARLVLAAALAAGCAAPDVAGPDPVADWMALYEARDYFRLRDELASAGPAVEDSPRVLFLRAAVQHAFNQPAASEDGLAAVLRHPGTTGELRREALLQRLQNLVRLFHYGEAARVAEQLLALEDAALDTTQRADVANMLKMTRALAGVPPQTLATRSGVVLDYGGDGRIAVRIADTAYRIPLDTGANLSVLMHSEATRLGLEILPAGIEVGTSTDRKVQADLAVAERVSIGPLEYRHVVFLVFPDELLTFPGGHVIEGVIGFPLIEPMGELRFRRDGSIEVPADVPERAIRNLALDQLELLVRVGYEGQGLVCRLDTGADDTTFYEPFYRSRPKLFEGLGEPAEVRSGGVGGVRTLAAYTLPRVQMELGGVDVMLEDVDVYTRPITDAWSNDLHCNVGRSALTALDGYAINFRSMSLVGNPVP